MSQGAVELMHLVLALAGCGISIWGSTKTCESKLAQQRRDACYATAGTNSTSYSACKVKHPVGTELMNMIFTYGGLVLIVVSFLLVRYATMGGLFGRGMGGMGGGY